MDSLCWNAPTLDFSDQTGTLAAAEPLRHCLERIKGDWVLDSADLPDLEAALDSAVATYPDAWRASVRDRLRAVARVPTRLNISLSWPEVAVSSDGGAGVRSRPDGVAVPFQDAGEEIWLATTWKTNRLVQVFQASDGLREDAYSLSPEERRLHLVATTSGDGMPRPLVITMRFRRP
ncbi:MAG: hypothetical protein IPN71_07535 [Fibrobacteres bacterium]|jgi:hypothetical protein|nr:hypothetical protein [Fibrobacterota bacterium]